ncbi:MAG: hypothetical protein KAQ71_19630, partial [Desulfobulbaceae bacterium]|nr:hypothetical protein [Desulfobulbaceae bacterium]
ESRSLGVRKCLCIVCRFQMETIWKEREKESSAGKGVFVRGEAAPAVIRCRHSLAVWFIF